MLTGMRVRVGRWLLLVLLVLALSGTAALLALPHLARSVAVWRLQAATGRPVTIQALDLSLTTGRFAVRGVRIADLDGGLLAEFDSLAGRFHRRSLLRRHLWIDDLTLTNPHVRIVRVGLDRFNVSDLLARPASQSTLAVTVDHVSIAGGWVMVEDRVLTPTHVWRSDDLQLDAHDLTTTGRRGTAVGSTTLAGAGVSVRVSELGLAPVHLRAQVNVRDLDLTLATLYQPPGAPLTLASGLVDAAFDIVHDAKEGTALNAEATVHDVALDRPGLAGHAVTTPELSVLVRELQQRPGAIVLRYASLEGDITVLDPTTSPPTPRTLRDVTLTASGLAQPMKGPATIALHATLPGGGEVDVGGTAGLAPRRADLRVRAHDVELPPLAQYVALAGRVEGVATADVRVAAAWDPAPALGVSGYVVVDRAALGDGTRPLVSAARVAVAGLEYTWPATLRLGQLTLTRPAVVVERDAAGALSLAALLARRPPPAAAAAPAPRAPAPEIEVTRLRIEDGRADVSDAATGGRVEVSRIDVTARDLTWPTHGTPRVRLSATVAGGEITARGTVDLSARRAEGALTISHAELATLQPWLPIAGRVRGAADADVTLALALDPLRLDLRGTFGVGALAFLDGDKPVLTVGRMDATGIDLAWPTRLAIDRLRVDAPWAEVARTTTGDLSLRALFARRADRPPAPPAAGVPPLPAVAGPVPGLQVSLRRARFDNGGVTLIDDAVEPAARFEVRGSQLTLRDLTWPARGAPAAVSLTTPMPGGGTLQAKGTFSIQPTTLALDVRLDQVDLAQGRSYLPFDARVAGKVSGRAKLTGTFGDAVTLVVEGDATADRLRIGDADRRLATAQAVELTGVRYQYPTTVRVRQLALRQPWLLVERNSDGSLELLTLFTRRVPALAVAPAGAPPRATGARPAPAAGVRVLVNALRLEDGFVRFVDRTTDPGYAEELSAITLVAEGLGTDPKRRATVDLRARFASGTPLAVRGQVSALTARRFLDLTVDVTDFPIPRLNPYLDRLSSWVARQGTLTAALRFKLDGDELEAANEVVVTALEVEQGGHGREFTRRIGLPLGTLVSLLKDRKGDIRLSVPVRGRLSAPEFDYGEAVWATLRNLAIRLVALPFSLIGKLFFTEDSRIESIQVDPVPFQTARATPTADGAEHLQKVAAFLTASPHIRLRRRPVTTVTDVTALRRAALDARLHELGADEAARRHAALGLYTELFPRRAPPASNETLYDELTRETPPAPRALGALRKARVEAVREALVKAGIAADRLQPQESRTAVESEGAARVEFEIAR